MERFASIKKDENALAEISISNDDNSDVFVAHWKYPIDKGMLITLNYIEINYRFKLDVTRLQILWKEKYGEGFVWLKQDLEITFFEIIDYLYDFNGTGNDYDKIVEILYEHRGAATAKQFGF